MRIATSLYLDAATARRGWSVAIQKTFLTVPRGRPAPE
jgi:hypothetical protein